MKKKIASLVLATLLAATAVAGCGGSGSAGGSSAAAGSSAAGSAAAGGSTIKIGSIGPVTGAAALYGEAVKNGAQLAVDEINAAGGIAGAKIDFKFEDDEHDPEKSVNAYNTLKDWGMQILMGTVTTNPCIAVTEKTAADKMFQITPSASSQDVIAKDNVFQVCFTDPNQGIASAKYIGEKKLATKVAVLYNSSDVYSKGIYEKFVEESKNQEAVYKIVAEEAFTDESKTDFSAQLNKFKSAGADLVFCPFYYQEASVVLKQASDMKYAPTFFGVDGMDGILDVENFDKKLAENVVLLTPFVADATDEKTQKFVAAYKKAYNNVTPIQFAADAYDAIYIIKDAVEKGGVNASMKTDEICEKMKAAITSLSFDGLTGTAMKWSADGAVNKEPKAMVIKNGAYTAMN